MNCQRSFLERRAGGEGWCRERSGLRLGPSRETTCFVNEIYLTPFQSQLVLRDGYLSQFENPKIVVLSGVGAYTGALDLRTGPALQIELEHKKTANIRLIINRNFLLCLCQVRPPSVR